MKSFYVAALICVLVGCAQPSRMGMVEDPNTELMTGSAIEKNLVLDSSQLQNKTIKVNIRNASGDAAYDLSSYRASLANALQRKGFLPTEGDDFGVKFDVNVMYSGYARTDMSKEYAFLGGTAGTIAGSTNSQHQYRGMATGALVGATLGAILGSYTRDETYIVIAEVTVAIADQNRGTTRKTITFSSSPPLQEERKSSIKPFEQMLRTQVAVYAGGRNVQQSRVADGVRERLTRIVADAI
jgi:hypothetical protein